MTREAQNVSKRPSSAWVVMVRDDNDETAFYGPFRKKQRAVDLATLVTQEIDNLDSEYEGPAWAYPVLVERPPSSFKAIAMSAWDPDATR